MPDSEFDDLTGIKFIREMSREELIEEVITHMRRKLSTESTRQLHAYVVGHRVEDYKDRLYKEANLEPSGILGLLKNADEDDES